MIGLFLEYAGDSEIRRNVATWAAPRLVVVAGLSLIAGVAYAGGPSATIPGVGPVDGITWPAAVVIVAYLLRDGISVTVKSERTAAK